MTGSQTSSTPHPTPRSGPRPYGLKATGITAQVSAGPTSSRTDAVSGNPANSQPTPGKPISPIGSS